MALPETSLPYGIREIYVAPLLASGGPDTANMVKLPNARTLSFSETEEFTELRGDDVVVARRGMGPAVEWELESGGISFAATVVMNGGSVVESGVAPNLKRTYRKKDTDSKPYFYAQGRSISDSGGDFHTKLYRIIASDGFEGEQADGEFWLTGASGSGLGSLASGETKGVIYDFDQNETAVSIEDDVA